MNRHNRQLNTIWNKPCSLGIFAYVAVIFSLFIQGGFYLSPIPIKS